MICKLSEWRMACALDTGASPPAWVTRHHSRCPRCRATHETERRIADTLRREAQTAGMEIDQRLHGRFMRAVRMAVQEDRTEPRSLSLGWIPAAALVMAVALGIWWETAASRHRRASETATVVQVRKPVHAAPGISLDLGVPLQALSESVERWGAAPFQSEATALRRDVTDASRFLLACVGGAE